MTCLAGVHVVTYGSTSSVTVGVIPNETCDCGAIRRPVTTAQEITDVDDLRGMLPDEILAEITALTQRAEQAERERDGTRRLAAYTATRYVGLLETLTRREPINHAEFSRFVQEAKDQRERAEQAEASLAGALLLADRIRQSEVNASDVLVAIINLRGPAGSHPLDGYSDQEGKPMIVVCDQAVSRSKDAYWSDMDISDRARELGAAVEGMAEALRIVDGFVNAAFGDGRHKEFEGMTNLEMIERCRSALQSYRAARGQADGAREGEQ